MDFYMIEAILITVMLVLGAIWIVATWNKPFWHWYYDGVLGGVPPPSDPASTRVSASATSSVAASSRASNSAPSSSAAMVHRKRASGTVTSQTVRISRKEYREALSRRQRKA